MAYDPATKSEKVLFDRALPFERTGIVFCIFDRMQLSPDGSILYLVSPVWATSGSLAIVHLASGRVTYLGGVDEVFVIEAGPHRGDLIFQRHMWRHGGRGGDFPYDPWVHAGPEGRQIKVLKEEPFTTGGSPAKDAPGLKAYLHGIGAQIVIDGGTFP